MANDNKISRAEALKRMGGLALGSAVAPLLAAQEEPNRASSSKPNILWITGEGVPLKVLSCYGSQLLRTPNIDRIANEGMRFANSF
ncbi:MAG TPA: hypothetical protein VF283_18550 [Bryobacteraceae bacterium]